MYLAVLKIKADLLEEELERLGPALDGINSGYYASRTTEGDDGSDWLMRWIVEDKPDIADLTLRLNIWCQAKDIDLSISENDWHSEKIDPDTDWLAESYQGFQPFEIAGFFIYGSHHEGDLPEDRILLQIDAATAFGSGEHPTTAGCLELLCALKAEGGEFSNILDMGCGSGILAIAVKKLWPKAAVIAVDIEEEAIRVTQRHMSLNNFSEDAISCAAGDGFQTPLVTDQKPFDLVIANILAGPLKEMASDLANVLESNGGSVILSGLLNEQAEDICEKYALVNLDKTRSIEKQEWTSLLLSNTL